MSDGIAKNMERVRSELQNFRREQSRNWRRLKSPSLNPKNREHFVPHVLTAFIEETYDTLPRTLTYLTWLVVVAALVIAIYS